MSSLGYTPDTKTPATSRPATALLGTALLGTALLSAVLTSPVARGAIALRTAVPRAGALEIAPLPRLHFEALDRELLRAEDAAREADGLPWRFAVPLRRRPDGGAGSRPRPAGKPGAPLQPPGRPRQDLLQGPPPAGSRRFPQG